jgi:hypothetical protein
VVVRQFIEQAERLENRIDVNDGAAIEPAQRRSVLDRPGIRNPRRQDGPLFRRGQHRIARDISGMGVDRRAIGLRRRSRLSCFEKAKALANLNSPQSGPPGWDREADRSNVFDQAAFWALVSICFG